VVATEWSPQEADHNKRAAKHVTCERIATGSCVLGVEARTLAPRDTRLAGEALTVTGAAVLDAGSLVKLSTMTAGPGPATKVSTTSFAL